MRQLLTFLLVIISLSYTFASEVSYETWERVAMVGYVPSYQDVIDYACVRHQNLKPESDQSTPNNIVIAYARKCLKCKEYYVKTLSLGNPNSTKSRTISSQRLQAAPQELASFIYLEALDLQSNKITRISSVIYNLKNLKILDLNQNRIDKIPTKISRLVNLERLLLAGNHLKRIPPHISTLKKLEYLDVSDNRVERIHPDIALLPNLKILLLHRNNISNLPLAVFQLQSLEGLNLEYNMVTLETIAGLTPERFKDFIKKNMLYSEHISIWQNDVLAGGKGLEELRVLSSKLLEQQ